MKLEDFKISPQWDTPEGRHACNSFYKEIWQDNEYNRFGIGVEPNDIVVDCGANIGIFSQYAINRGAKKVYAYECGDEEFKYLNINTANNNTIVTTQGYVSDLDSYNNFNLEKIFKTHNLTNIDFIKVDIEGYEYSFILNANTEYFNKVNKWAIELHIFGMFENSPEYFGKVFQIIEKFSFNGFKVSMEHIHKNTNLFMLYASK